jgi:hypothetical protein
MRFLPAAALVFVLLGLALVAGCARSDRKPVYPVHGQVLFDGQPIPHALVTLHSLDASAKDAPKPHGSVDKEGRFILTTYDSGDGAPAGDYAVTVEWWLTNATARTGEGNSLPPTNRLPARYSRAETSKLQVKIQAGENQIPVIKLSR